MSNNKQHDNTNDTKKDDHQENSASQTETEGTREQKLKERIEELRKRDPFIYR